MTLDRKNLEAAFAGSSFGISARRLWEHTELGQKNVFGRDIDPRPERNDAGYFIDVVKMDDDDFSLAGYSLAELRDGRLPSNATEIDGDISLLLAASERVRALVRAVEQHIRGYTIRKGVRSQHIPFLPPPQKTNVFGVAYLFSTLQHRLRTLNAKAGAAQWKNTIDNLQKKGLRAEEFDCSNLMQELAHLHNVGEKCRSDQLADLCDFSAIRLSVIPVLDDAKKQLRFKAGAPRHKLRQARKMPKAQAGQTRSVIGFDAVLGYRLEQVDHVALWGAERHWQAVAHDGTVVSNERNRILFTSAANAAAQAADHASLHFPKRVALGHWSHIAWGGGNEYREWLITLPHYPKSYFSSHFQVRNVLAHVRCDLRDGPDGEHILFLQEVQSDWAQNARRANRDGDSAEEEIHSPPFLKEWPAVAIKLMTLHAAHHGLDAVAWTKGAHQAKRYSGLGAAGLKELYDSTLPRLANKMLKPFNCACEPLGVFVPTNFTIKQSELGYQVFNSENKLLATAHTLEDARQFVPDGGHEYLHEVHGFRLSKGSREAILASGFPAWG